MTGDLHCHTNRSDGSMEPEDLVELASRLELSCIAVTDHDTMDGVAQAQRAGSAACVRVLPGVELSSYDFARGKKVHLLCYFPRKTGELARLCRETLAKRTAAGEAMAEKVASRYPVTLTDARRCMGPSAALYKQHILEALMERGYALSVFGDLWNELFSTRKNGWAYVGIRYPDARDVLRLAKETGGAAVLAHPGVYGNFELIGELAELGLDGVEVWHPRQTEEDTRRAFEAAERYRLLRTGGTDFHGSTASKVTPLGTCRTEEDQLAELLRRFGES